MTQGHEYDGNLIPTGRSALAYEWHAPMGKHHAQDLVRVRCDLISTRGVPIPRGWQTAVRCSGLQEVADEAAKAAREDLERDIACKLLGVAQRTTLPEPGEQKPGATVLLANDGSRMAFLLSAQIDGDTWLCHRGSFRDGKMNETDPLHEHDLVPG